MNLLKISEIDQKWVFFGRIDQFFFENTFKFFEGGKLGLFYLEGFTNDFFAQIFSKLTNFAVLCKINQCFLFA